jgi:hypothetical protein
MRFIDRLRFWWRMRRIGATIGIPMDGSRRVWIDGRTLVADQISWEYGGGVHTMKITILEISPRERMETPP